MSTTLYLVRHGETDWNKLHRFQGRTDILLNKDGIAQAECLNKRFSSQFDVIYTSPLKRAVQTAKIIAKDLDIKPAIYEDLIEIDFGEWEGSSFKDIKEKFKEEYQLWQTDEEIGPLMGGESSMKNASIRARNSIYDIINNNIDKKIIIVAHGGIIKAGLLGIFNLNMNMYHSLFLDNTSVTTIKFYEDRNPVILGFNDTSHLVV